MNRNNSQIPDIGLFVCEVDDPALNLRGWLAIHTIGPRGCCGGIRLYPDVTKEETIALAKAMTLKYCICGYSLGGAKVGVQIPFDADNRKREAMLENFGRHIGLLIKAGIYHPWMDMNCSLNDMRSIYKGAGKKLKFTPADSALFTALSTFSSLSAVAEHLGVIPSQCKVTIEGFGNVGSQLAIEIDRWGGRVVAVSNRLGAVFNPEGLDVKALSEKRLQLGESWIEQKGSYQRLSCEQIYSIDTTIHIPCARVHSLTIDKAERLICKAVVPAANDPCDAGVEPKLYEKGILPLPYFVVNIGGITGSGLASRGATDAQVRQIFSVEYHRMIMRLLKSSEKTSASPVEIATREAAINYKLLFDSAGLVKKKRSLLSKFGITVEPSLRKKIQELKETFNSRFASSLGDAGVEPATR